MNSCLYECTVMHRRLRPREHRFVYRIFMFLLDLDELEAVSHEVPLFSADEPNLYSLRKEDYFRLSTGSLRENITLFLESEGRPEPPARIRLLTLPRLLGYTFNPISIFFCDDDDGRPIGSVVQVGNTFGEFKPYFVPHEGDVFHRRVRKDFYVSPFSSLDLSFDFRFQPPGEQLRVWIDDYDESGRTLVSTLAGHRIPLTTAALAAMTLRYPFVTAKVIFLIHWEALRLWLKKIPFHRKESSPERQLNAFHARPDGTAEEKHEGLEGHEGRER